MHHIQISILDQLIAAKIRRFSELRPSYVESNLFQYHLRHLIKAGYVDKVEGGYSLSPKGLYYADRHSSSLRTVREQPKIITIVVVRNSLGQALLVRKAKQPFVGSYNLPAGKLHNGESINQAAVRELQEKTGLVGVALSHDSTVHTRILAADQLISEFVAFVYLGTTNLPVADAHWYGPKSPSGIELAPSVVEILRTLDGAAPVLTEIEIQLQSHM